jgi:hypothetical protein
MMKDSGRMFRSGVRIKDFGERLARVPVLRFFAPTVTKWGIAKRDLALTRPGCSGPKPAQAGRR